MCEIKKLQSLSKEDVESFQCGKNDLDSYIKDGKYKRDIKKDFSKFYGLFVNNKFAGFYTLSTSSIQKDQISTKESKPYPAIPTLLIGRLAVSKQYQGNGYSYNVMAHIFKNVIDIYQKAGVVFLMLVAIDNDIISFYEKLGFKLISEDDSKVMALKISSLIS